MKFCSCNVNKVWYTFGFFLVLYVIFLPLKRLRTWINYTVVFKLNFEYFMFPCSLLLLPMRSCTSTWSELPFCVELLRLWSTTEDLRMFGGKIFRFCYSFIEEYYNLHGIARIHSIKKRLGSWKFDRDFGQHTHPPQKKVERKKKKYIFVVKIIAKT